MAFHHSPKIMTDGLTLYYDAANPKSYPGSGSTVYNLADKTKNGTITGATWNSNGYFYFDGTSLNQIVFSEDMGYQSLFSLECWIYDLPGGDSRHSIIRNFWETEVQYNRLGYWSYEFADEYWRYSTTDSVPSNEWTHCITTWDGSIIRHYINGDLNWADSSASSGTSQANTQIGGYSGRDINARLALVKMYDICLTPSQIKQNYDATKGRFGL